MDGAAPEFRTGSADFAILLLHGFKATPYEMREYGIYLHEKLKATISIPLLPNHGVNYEKMNLSKWEEWDQFATDEYLKLKKNYSKVFIIGMSMGGALALRVASKHQATGLICVGTPYQLNWKTKFASILSLFKNHINDLSGPDIKNPEQKAKAVTLYNIPLYALTELIAMLKNSQKLYKNVNSPIMICHSINDHVIPFNNMKKLIYLLNKNPIEEHIFENSYHIIPLDNDRYDLFDKSISFIKNLI